MDNWGKIKPPFDTPADPAWVKTMGNVGLWTMNERAGIKIFDGSGYNNTGTMTNMDNPSTATSGWAKGKGLSFDGVNDWVNVGTGSSLNLGTGSFTAGAWIKRNAVGTYFPIFEESVSGQGWQWRIFLYIDNKIYVYTRNVAFQAYNVVGSSVADTSWHHIVAVRDITAGQMYVYKDGIRQTMTIIANDAGIGVDINSPNPLIIGGNGLIDDVRIYNRALSADEVWKEYVTPYYMYPRKTTKYFIPPAQGIPIELLQSGNLMGVR